VQIKLNKIKDIFTNYPIEFSYVYGSMAKGTPRSWSDLDIALIVTDNIPPEQYLEIETDVSKKIDELLPNVESDVRIFNYAPLNFKIQIVQEGKLLYSKNENKRVNFETQVRDEYFDFLPLRKEYQTSFLKGIEKGGLLWSTPKK